MSLRTRITLLVATAVAIGVAVVSIAAYALARDGARGEVDEFLRRRGAAAGFVQVLDIEEINRRFPGRMPGGRQGQEPGPGRQLIEEDVVVQFVLPGAVLRVGDSDIALPVEDVDRDVAQGVRSEVLRDADVEGQSYRMLTTRVAPGVAMQVARDLGETATFLAGLRTRLILLGLAGVLLAASAGWWVARRAMQPVAALTEAAENVSETHDLRASIPVDRDDEIGRLAMAFNAMLAGLEEARASQRRLVADASHELRTPLTALRTNIELVARGAIPGDELPGVLEDARAELIELSTIVDELVELAMVGRSDEPMEPIDLADLVTRVVDRARRRATTDITMNLEATPIEARVGAMSRAIGNLVDNAVKWGGDAGPIDVELLGRRLAVRDRGPGIAAEDRPRVFDRFYRSSSARTTPGSGLGLSIVAAVVADHGGTVFADEAEGGGAVVGFRL
ncbi:MAG TPA: ATP-binding protein [Acidimicrobiia bacterium]|nr:ATP-binding protein [Acidimicrobiia bacterium]